MGGRKAAEKRPRSARASRQLGPHASCNTAEMGRGGHGHGHSDDDDVGGTPYDQSLEELEFMRSACSAAQRGQTEKLRGMLDKKPESLHWVRAAG